MYPDLPSSIPLPSFCIILSGTSPPAASVIAAPILNECKSTCLGVTTGLFYSLPKGTAGLGIAPSINPISSTPCSETKAGRGAGVLRQSPPKTHTSPPGRYNVSSSGRLHN